MTPATAELLADGKITLWFKDGDDFRRDEATLTYTDGANSVKVIGDCTNIGFKFGAGDDAERFASFSEAGAFSDFVNDIILQKIDPGMLA